jgi:putative peptide zinc metalloprotease protein
MERVPVQSGNQEAVVLPRLREELTVLPARPLWSGAGTWTIHDPVRNLYFRVGSSIAELLACWQATTISRFRRHASSLLDREVNADEINQAARFLSENLLVHSDDCLGWQVLKARAEANRKPLWQRAIHSYLFFRIPLIRPQPVIDFLWPWVSPLYSRKCVFTLAVLFLVAAWLLSRQWEAYLASFAGFVTPAGIVLSVLSIALVKILHEFGHAFMAKRYGISIPVMGVAFILAWPVLYTDTSGAHFLNSKRQRILIDLGGVLVEIAMAIVASLAWIFLEPGLLRSSAFFLSAISWIMSLLVNLNPFMRFDGYYLISDMLGIDNLQNRGNALARWKLSEWLFGLGKAPPEHLPAHLSRILVWHAWGTWIYRFFLFLAIALLVYHFFFKLAGIFLFAVEILWFILMPIWREVCRWWSMRSEIAFSPRAMLTGGVIAFVVLACFLPIRNDVHLPAALQHGRSVSIFPPQPARILTVYAISGAKVREGDVLINLAAPELAHDRLQTDRRIALLQTRLARIAANPTERSLLAVLEKELAGEKKALAALDALQTRLAIRAPMDGIIVQMDHALQPGRWVSINDRLLIVSDPRTARLTAYVAESDRRRIAPGTAGKFYPSTGLPSHIPVETVSIGRLPASDITNQLVLSTNGGSLPVRQVYASAGSENIHPDGNWFQVDLVPQGGDIPEQFPSTLQGTVILDGEGYSLIASAMRRIVSVFLRESGF